MNARMLVLSLAILLPAAARADDDKDIVLPTRQVQTRAGLVHLLDRSKPEVKLAVEGKEAFPCEKKIITLHRFQVKVTMKAEVTEKVREQFTTYPDIAQSQRLIGCFADVRTATGKQVEIASLQITQNKRGGRGVAFEFVPPKGEFVVTCYHILKLNDLTDDQRTAAYEAILKDKDTKKLMDLSDQAKEKHKDTKRNVCAWIARHVKNSLALDKDLSAKMQLIEVGTSTYIDMDPELPSEGHACFIVRSPKGLIFFDSTQQVTGHFDTQEAILDFSWISSGQRSSYPPDSAEHSGMTLMASDFKNDAMPAGIKAAKEMTKFQDTLLFPDLKKAAEKDKTLKPLIDPLTK